MTSATYQRVDVERVGAAPPAAGADTEAGVPPPAAPPAAAAAREAMGIRWLVLPLTLLVCAGQAFLTIWAEHRTPSSILTPALIPVTAFGVLFVLGLGVNPLAALARRLRARSAAHALAAAGVAAAVLAALWWGYGPLTEAVGLTPQSPQRVLAPLASLRCMAMAAAGLLLLLLLLGPRPFNRAEAATLFAALLVTSGVSTFGLVDQLLPLVGTPQNEEWNTPASQWDKLWVGMNPRLYLQDREQVRRFREGIGTTLAPPPADAGFGQTLAYYGRVARAVPWGAWLPPLTYWLIFVAAAYGLFYSLTYVVLGYWSDREKLIFPLARLSEALLPGTGTDAGDGTDRKTVGWMPPILRTGGFWMGFLGCFLLLSWNAANSAQWVSGLSVVPLGMGEAPVNAMLGGTAFEGLGFDTLGFPLMFLIIPTAIGIAFLLPLEISFSIWFYYLLSKFFILVLCWMGYGRTGADFPTDWLWYNSPVTAQGGGGILLFSAISLYRCVKDYLGLARGKSPAKAIRLALPVVGMVACMTVMTLWLAWNKLPVFWAAVLVLATTLLTVGLMRIVAEGGIYWFQAHTSFFHLYKFLGLGRMGSISPAVLGPILPIYSVLFIDIKTFLAPNLLNAGKMQKDAGAGRAAFHLHVLLALAVTVVVSLFLSLVFAYAGGAQHMNDWFYNQAPRDVMGKALSATTDAPLFNGATATWYALGAVWMGITLFARRTLFWFPHPIGYIMLINPLIAQLWFNFFLGWVCKKVVVQYGGKATFDKVRTVFIGLILGELIAILYWSGLQLAYNITIGLTLNRYG